MRVPFEEQEEKSFEREQNDTEGTIYCTQVLYWVIGGGGEECGNEEKCY